MTAKRVLIDTSIWIAFFRNKTPGWSQRVEEIIAQNEIYVPKIVIAELLQGSKSEAEVEALRDFGEAFHVIDQKEDTWMKAGELSYRLKRKGKGVNLADCYIGVIAEQHSCRVFTLDEHFKEIGKALGLELIEV
jgi:predicted nucleic acid-binding protein